MDDGGEVDWSVPTLVAIVAATYLTAGVRWMLASLGLTRVWAVFAVLVSVTAWIGMGAVATRRWRVALGAALLIAGFGVAFPVFRAFLLPAAVVLASAGVVARLATPRW